MEFLHNLYWYIRRTLTNKRPHGKHCGCSNWGLYLGMGCPNPCAKLNIKVTKMKFRTIRVKRLRGGKK